MIDDLTKALEEFSDGYLLDKEKNNNDILIVKKNFYISKKENSKFVFVPTGSIVKFVKYNKSTIPYYEISSYIVELKIKDTDVLIKGNRTINSGKETKELTIRNCTCESKEGKNYLDYNETILWSDLFVQSFESIINV